MNEEMATLNEIYQDLEVDDEIVDLLNSYDDSDEEDFNEAPNKDMVHDEYLKLEIDYTKETDNDNTPKHFNTYEQRSPKPSLPLVSKYCIATRPVYSSQTTEQRGFHEKKDSQRYFSGDEITKSYENVRRTKSNKFSFKTNENTLMLRNIIKDIIINRDKKLQQKQSQNRHNSFSREASRSISPNSDNVIEKKDNYLCQDKAHLRWRTKDYDPCYSPLEVASRASPPTLQQASSSRCWASNKNIYRDENVTASSSFNPAFPVDQGVKEIFDKVRLLEDSDRCLNQISPNTNSVLPSVSEENITLGKKEAETPCKDIGTEPIKFESDEKGKTSLEEKLELLIDTFKCYIEEQKRKSEADSSRMIKHKLKNKLDRACTDTKINRAKSESIKPIQDSNILRNINKITVTESELKVSKDEFSGVSRKCLYEFSKAESDTLNNIDKSKIHDSQDTGLKTPPNLYKISVDFNLNNNAHNTAEKDPVKFNKSTIDNKSSQKQKSNAAVNTDPYWPDLTLHFLAAHSMRKILSLVPALRSYIPIPNLSTLMSDDPRLLTCSSCGRSFDKPSDFGQHPSYHARRKGAHTEQSGTGHPDEVNKLYQCSFCDQRYMTSNGRQLHEKICSKNKQAFEFEDRIPTRERGN